MGQQQLLLVILVTVIVGVATVAAINTFQVAADESNFDAIRQDILQAQAHATDFIIKPIHIGGGGGGSFIGMTLEDILLPEENENAAYQLNNVTQGSFSILATTVYGFSVTATITGDEVQWERDLIEP